MSDYNATQTSSATLNGTSTDIPVSAVVPPGETAPVTLKGGPKTQDSNGKYQAPAAMYVYDGNDVTLGAKGDSAATDSTSSWSVISLLKGIIGKLLTSIAVTQSGTWNITNVSGTVSLPTGASTSAKQPALGTAGTASSDVITVQGIASMTALKVDGSGVTQPVSGTFWQTTQPISGTVNAAQSGTWTIQPGNTANTTAWLVDEAAAQGPINITVAGGASGGTSPTFTGTCTANADNSITFASKVRKVMLHNQSTSNVPYEHDIAASATSAYIAPGTIMYVDVHTTTLHVYPSNSLPINGASGLIVRGWA